MEEHIVLGPVLPYSVLYLFPEGRQTPALRDGDCTTIVLSVAPPFPAFLIDCTKTKHCYFCTNVANKWTVT